MKLSSFLFICSFLCFSVNAQPCKSFQAPIQNHQIQCVYVNGVLSHYAFSFEYDHCVSPDFQSLILNPASGSISNLQNQVDNDNCWATISGNLYPNSTTSAAVFKLLFVNGTCRKVVFQIPECLSTDPCEILQLVPGYGEDYCEEEGNALFRVVLSPYTSLFDNGQISYEWIVDGDVVSTDNTVVFPTNNTATLVITYQDDNQSCAVSFNVLPSCYMYNPCEDFGFEISIDCFAEGLGLASISPTPPSSVQVEWSLNDIDGSPIQQTTGPSTNFWSFVDYITASVSLENPSGVIDPCETFEFANPCGSNSPCELLPKVVAFTEEECENGMGLFEATLKPYEHIFELGGEVSYQWLVDGEVISTSSFAQFETYNTATLIITYQDDAQTCSESFDVIPSCAITDPCEALELIEIEEVDCFYEFFNAEAVFQIDPYWVNVLESIGEFNVLWKKVGGVGFGAGNQFSFFSWHIYEVIITFNDPSINCEYRSFAIPSCYDPCSVLDYQMGSFQCGLFGNTGDGGLIIHAPSFYGGHSYDIMYEISTYNENGELISMSNVYPIPLQILGGINTDPYVMLDIEGNPAFVKVNVFYYSDEAGIDPTYCLTISGSNPCYFNSSCIQLENISVYEIYCEPDGSAQFGILGDYPELGFGNVTYGWNYSNFYHETYTMQSNSTATFFMRYNDSFTNCDIEVPVVPSCYNFCNDFTVEIDDWQCEGESAIINFSILGLDLPDGVLLSTYFTQYNESGLIETSDSIGPSNSIPNYLSTSNYFASIEFSYYNELTGETTTCYSFELYNPCLNTVCDFIDDIELIETFCDEDMGAIFEVSETLPPFLNGVDTYEYGWVLSNGDVVVGQTSIQIASDETASFYIQYQDDLQECDVTLYAIPSCSDIQILDPCSDILTETGCSSQTAGSILPINMQNDNNSTWVQLDEDEIPSKFTSHVSLITQGAFGQGDFDVYVSDYCATCCKGNSSINQTILQMPSGKTIKRCSNVVAVSKQDGKCNIITSSCGRALSQPVKPNISVIGIEISPNPVSGGVISIFPDGRARVAGPVSYSIINLNGKVMINGVKNGTESIIDVSSLDSGLYYLNVIFQNGRQQSKSFVVMR